MPLPVPPSITSPDQQNAGRPGVIDLSTLPEQDIIRELHQRDALPSLKKDSLIAASIHEIGTITFKDLDKEELVLWSTYLRYVVYKSRNDFALLNHDFSSKVSQIESLQKEKQRTHDYKEMKKFLQDVDINVLTPKKLRPILYSFGFLLAVKHPDATQVDELIRNGLTYTSDPAKEIFKLAFSSDVSINVDGSEEANAGTGDGLVSRHKYNNPETLQYFWKEGWVSSVVSRIGRERNSLAFHVRQTLAFYLGPFMGEKGDKNVPGSIVPVAANIVAACMVGRSDEDLWVHYMMPLLGTLSFYRVGKGSSLTHLFNGFCPEYPAADKELHDTEVSQYILDTFASLSLVGCGRIHDKTISQVLRPPAHEALLRVMVLKALHIHVFKHVGVDACKEYLPEGVSYPDISDKGDYLTRDIEVFISIRNQIHTLERPLAYDLVDPEESKPKAKSSNGRKRTGKGKQTAKNASKPLPSAKSDTPNTKVRQYKDLFKFQFERYIENNSQTQSGKRPPQTSAEDRSKRSKVTPVAMGLYGIDPEDLDGVEQV